MSSDPDNTASGSAATAHSSKGEWKVWQTAAGLTVGVLMILALLLLVAWNGLEVFWPKQVEAYTIRTAPDQTQTVAGYISKEQVRRSMTDGSSIEEVQIFTGNREVYGLAFRYVEKADIEEITVPAEILMAERTEYGYAFFLPKVLTLSSGKEITVEDEAFQAELARLVTEGNDRRDHIEEIEKHDIGAINYRIQKAEIALRKAEDEASRTELEATLAELQEQYEERAAEAKGLRDAQEADMITYQLVSGETKTEAVSHVIHYFAPNQLTLGQKFGVFFHRAWSFITENPREANTEGGVFPAIFGTFVMTVLMAAMVTPLGIIAAIYLREYARQGTLVRIVRICVNNLAGVPSIVFGVFGLGFFVYGVGGFIDGGPRHPLPERWWYLAALGGIGSLAGALILSSLNRAAIPLRKQRRSLQWSESLLWVSAVALVILTIVKCPYFHGFFPDKLPSPTYGTGGILWASLTLALMTLPVVIVATEEALAAVPRGVREAALACGASKWQMIQRIVLPAALPGVMTGVILAMARGAGEVAPLMITGVVKLAPSLPIDGTAPFIHAERKFMHLGFHIYDLGFQSPDSEAAKPMVFATTLLLILLVVVLNLAAIQIRSHLRRKFQASAF